MVHLEKFGSEDFEQLIQWINDPVTMKKWSGSLFKFPLTHDTLQWYIQDSNDSINSSSFNYKIIETATGTSVGHISIGGISRKNRSARITRVFLAPETRGKGFCVPALQQAMAIAFDELKMHRLELGVYTGNPSAEKCYTRAGFRSEGIHRDNFYYRGEFWSIHEMSILEDEWVEIKATAAAANPKP